MQKSRYNKKAVNQPFYLGYGKRGKEIKATLEAKASSELVSLSYLIKYALRKTFPDLDL